jgi:hypothetical protein
MRNFISIRSLLIVINIEYQLLDPVEKLVLLIVFLLMINYQCIKQRKLMSIRNEQLIEKRPSLDQAMISGSTKVQVSEHFSINVGENDSKKKLNTPN